jgi:hypothetical protein
MVEVAYENYLINECKKQMSFKNSLEKEAIKLPTVEEQERALRRAKEFELGRCTELEDLFPQKKNYRR